MSLSALFDKPNLADGAAAGFGVPNPLSPVRPMPPRDWQTGLPDAASPLMHQLSDLNRLFVVVAAAVFVLVAVLLVWVLIRYRHRGRPAAVLRGDRVLLQVSWIGLSSVLMVFLAVPALTGLAGVANMPQPDVSVEAVGQIGQWTYVYPRDGNVRFDSRRLDAKTAKQYEQPYLLAADPPLVVPVGRVVEVLVTSADVVHSWGVPALGVRADAVPGRVNRIWFKPMREGVYYGMCSEFCGARQQIMPITVNVVSGPEYGGWLSWAYQQYGDGAIAEKP